LSQLQRSDVPTFTKQAEQQVLGSDEVAAQLTCLFLGERKDTSALVGESLKHGASVGEVRKVSLSR